MKTVRRLLYADIVSSVVFVALAFLSLFFFIDFVDALSDAARRGAGAVFAAAYSLLELPGHLYELAPIAVLIGTIYSLSRMAQSSEFTILRTGGLAPGRALALLAGLGVAFGRPDPADGRLRGALGRAARGADAGAGARQPAPGGLGRLAEGPADTARAASAPTPSTSVEQEQPAPWKASASSSSMPTDGCCGASAGEVGHRRRRCALGASRACRTHDLAPGRASSGVGSQPGPGLAGAKPRANGCGRATCRSTWWRRRCCRCRPMSTLELRALHRPTSSDNEQAAQQYEIQFWKRALYPFACLVMVGAGAALRLPACALWRHQPEGVRRHHAGHQLRAAEQRGRLTSACCAAGRPGSSLQRRAALYLLMSMAAFAWLVRYR